MANIRAPAMSRMVRVQMRRRTFGPLRDFPESSGRNRGWRLHRDGARLTGTGTLGCSRLPRHSRWRLRRRRVRRRFKLPWSNTRRLDRQILSNRSSSFNNRFISAFVRQSLPTFGTESAVPKHHAAAVRAHRRWRRGTRRLVESGRSGGQPRLPTRRWRR